MPKKLTQALSVAVLGSGGREHALAWKISKSTFCKNVCVIPGNAGIARSGIKTVTFSDGFTSTTLLEKLKTLAIDLVVIGPDDLLADGVADFLTEAGFLVFGPSKSAAKLEWSKAFSKEILACAHVPTAKSVLLKSADPTNLSVTAEHLGGYPLVLKYDGLALGKGVRICQTQEEAQLFLHEIFDSQKFNRNSDRPDLVVAEQYLKGHEVSLFALADGEDYAVLAPACDHKRLLEGNRGPNTGGMGAYSPVPWLDEHSFKDISDSVFSPVLKEMKKRGTPFQGLLYAGMMVQGSNFWVIEFNARFGDPETQTILPRMNSDLLPLLHGVATGSLKSELETHPLRWSEKSCVNIVAASKGYPEKAETGFPIPPFQVLDESNETYVFFSGVKESANSMETAGGRVFSVSALGDDTQKAKKKSEEILQKMKFEGMHYRRDIGQFK